MLAAPLSQTRSFFLRSVAFCFALAFASLYPQIEGLYGARGVLPAKSVLDSLPEAIPSTPNLSKFHPNVLRWIRTELGVRADLAMDLLCILGAIVSTLMTLFPSQCNKFAFALLWVCYKSLFDVGRTFLWFQWDTLLLEVGFLCIVIAPLWRNDRYSGRPWDALNLFLVKWLLFRMMFSSGVVKLLSECPAWWGLTALPVHYESQCLPTWVSWYVFQLPDWFHRLSVVGTYFIEIPLTFLFFAPTTFLRKFTFWHQIILMVVIMLTGNYNFFNLLFMALCLSLADDYWFDPFLSAVKRPRNIIFRIASWLLNAAVLGGLFYLTFVYCIDSAKWGKKEFIRLRFTKSQFRRFVDYVGVNSIYVGLFFLGLATVRALIDSLRSYNKMYNLTGTCFYSLVSFAMFCLSTPRFLQGMDVRSPAPTLPGVFTDLYHQTNHLALTHSYGLFRSMTGVGGRPEIILESSLGPDGPWKELHFKYKPGSLDGTPRFSLPHQARLDWQMWFAALGSYQQNPWLISLIYRILKNEPAVVGLLQEIPHRKPKFIRIQKYDYHYTRDVQGDDYWRRDPKGEYLPPVTLDSRDFVQLMARLGYVKEDGRDLEDRSSNLQLEKLLIQLRQLTRTSVSDHVLVQSLVLLLAVNGFLFGF